MIKFVTLPLPNLVADEEVIALDTILEVLKAVGINAASYFLCKLIEWLFSEKN